jgi:rhodanese-related sulfurtransferase
LGDARRRPPPRPARAIGGDREVFLPGTLGQLPQRFQEIPKDKPVAIICRSGARSARATLFLRQNGFDRVANVSGGMLRWRTQNLTVE